MSGKHGQRAQRGLFRSRGGSTDAARDLSAERFPAHSRAHPGDATARSSGTRTATIELPPRLPAGFPIDLDAGVHRGAGDDRVGHARYVDDLPDPSAASSSSVDLIVPAGRGSRHAARQEQREQRRKRVLAIGAGALVVGLIAWGVTTGSGKSHKHAAVAPSAARTQTTMLVQIKGADGQAVDSALLAHDPQQHSGVVVLVPSAVIGQVPGFGSMPFGQTLSVGQPNAARATLSDLMGVTVDSSWVLTTHGLQALVDKVGGVTVTVDADVTKPGPNGTTVIVVAAGHQKLTGANAVAFATFLGPNETEPLRLARFDAVFGAVLAQLPKQPAALAQVLTGLGADSTSSAATSRVADVLAGLAADTAAGSTVDTVLPVKKLDTGSDQEAFSLDATANAALVKQQLAESIPKNKLATGNRVMIENQVGTPGIGETTRSRLLNAGFTYLPGQNAPGMPNATAPSVVLISGTTSADIAKGNAVATALGLPTSDVRVSQETIQVADIVVLLGADYKP